MYNTTMIPRIPVLLRVVFPLLLLSILNIWPAPRMVAYNLSRAAIAERNNRPDMAAAALVTVAEMQPYRHLEERIGLALALSGDYQQAAAMFNSVKGSLLSPQALAAWADALEKLGQEEAALQVWEKAAQRLRTAEPYRRMTLLLRQQGRYDEALQMAKEWKNFDPDDPQPAYQVGLLLAADSPEEAVSMVEMAAELDARFVPLLGSMRIASGQAGLHDDPAYRLTVMGRWLSGAGEWDLAEVAFSRAAKISPEYAEAWAFWGQARLARGLNGLPELEKAVQINPRSVLAQALLSTFYAGQERYDLALVHMRAAADLEPLRAVWQVELGNFSAADGDVAGAQDHFSAARDLEPDNPLVWEASARFCLQYGIGLRDLGLPAARHLIRMTPDKVVGYDLAGAILLNLGDLRSAERFLQQSLVVDRENSTAHYYLGLVYLQLSLPEQALDHLRQAATLDPESGTAKSAQILLEKYLGEG